MRIKPISSGSKGNCYLIDDGKTTLLLDAGISIKKIREGCNFHLSDVAGALITHRHMDHAKAIPDLIKSGVDVYANSDVVAFIGATGRRFHTICNGVGINAVRWTDIGTFRVLPFDVHHDVPNLGFYIHSTATGENLLYFTDTYYIDQVFPNLNYILAEANYSADVLNKNISSGHLPPEFKKRLVQSHMSINNLLEMLKSNDLSEVKQIYLLHLSDNNSKEDEFKRMVAAETGCEVYIC